ncbi:MAG: quinoprotein relay system zinc metallohydrolase 2 [Gammaproteobacteria bacterium]
MNKLLWIIGCVWLLLPCADAAAALSELDVKEVAPGVYVHEGHIEPMTAANRGDTANIGFVVGDDCVAVIDTGGSPQVGNALRVAIETRTDKPVCFVINTHAHPDHVFGNSAFVGLQPTFIAHNDYAQALGARMQTYLERFSGVYGHKLSAEIIVAPDRTVQKATTLDLGNRLLKLTALPVGHTNNDLIVYDTRTATLWTGDALFVEHIPVLDGRLLGWLEIMDQLQSIEARRAVPGHGPASVAWPQALNAQRQYLSSMAQEIRAIIKRGGTIEEAIDTVGHEARKQWRLFSEYHRRNVTSAFAELEWE